MQQLIKCNKCGGYIPELRFGGANIHDCKNHIKQDKFILKRKEYVRSKHGDEML